MSKTERDAIETAIAEIRDELESVAESQPWRDREKHIPAFAALSTLEQDMRDQLATAQAENERLAYWNERFRNGREIRRLREALEQINETLTHPEPWMLGPNEVARSIARAALSTPKDVKEVTVPGPQGGTTFTKVPGRQGIVRFSDTEDVKDNRCPNCGMPGPHRNESECWQIQADTEDVKVCPECGDSWRYHMGSAYRTDRCAAPFHFERPSNAEDVKE